MNHADRIANFERIETLVHDGNVETMTLSEVKALRRSLLADGPTSENPRFEQRLQRVDAALVSRLTDARSWWEKPVGIVVISVIASLIAAAAVFYLGWQ